MRWARSSSLCRHDPLAQAAENALLQQAEEGIGQWQRSNRYGNTPIDNHRLAGNAARGVRGKE